MLQVTIDDAAVADRTFDMLMGSEVAPRRVHPDPRQRGQESGHLAQRVRQTNEAGARGCRLLHAEISSAFRFTRHSSRITPGPLCTLQVVFPGRA